MTEEKRNGNLGEKKEYIAIDVMKVLCAFLVMGIHFMPFIDIDLGLNFWFTEVLARIAVPFFFLSAGYFAAGKFSDKEKVLSYIKRIFSLYVIYTIIYMKFVVEEYLHNDKLMWIDICDFVKRFFLVGSYIHLWYLLALAVAVGVLYFLLYYVKWDEKRIFIFAVFMYCIGTCGNAYRNLFYKIPILKFIIDGYESIFVTTTNGLFFGLLYVVLGYLIYKYRDRIEKKAYWLYAILFFVLMNFEEYFAKMLTNHEGQSMLFVTPFVTVTLFLALGFVELPQKGVVIGKAARNIAFLLYAWHLFIHFEVGRQLTDFLAGLSYTLMISKRIILFCVCLYALSRLRFCSWLKKLY